MKSFNRNNMGIVESLNFLEASYDEKLIKVEIDITEMEKENKENKENKEEERKIIQRFKRKFLFSKL